MSCYSLLTPSPKPPPHLPLLTSPSSPPPPHLPLLTSPLLTHSFDVTLSYLEIHNDIVRDLLRTGSEESKLELFETPQGVVVPGLTVVRIKRGPPTHPSTHPPTPEAHPFKPPPTHPTTQAPTQAPTQATHSSSPLCIQATHVCGL